MPLQFARDTINQTFYADEAQVLARRVAQTGLDAAARQRIEAGAAQMVRAIRADSDHSLMESLLAEYGLSDDEGLALMCLAEAYLRVPDAATLDALIRDKVGSGQWMRHAGEANSPLVNASTWGLILSGEIYGDPNGEKSPLNVVRRLVKRVGEPLVRTAVGVAMRAMGQQFVLGKTIEAAVAKAQPQRAKAYRYSYDMLGEAARTEADAAAYFDAYEHAIDVLAAYATDDDVFLNPGISIKLSALHPRYETTQSKQVLPLMVARLTALAKKARAANLGFNIDAEEANRLDLSLSVIEAVIREPIFKDWHGFGMVVQAYSKQALPVLQWFYQLAELLDRQFAVRLVKGAYWDSEIKHAQALGLSHYPVFTRKAGTDISYMAGARFLLSHSDRLFGQFATHNAHTIAAVVEMAQPDSRFEFQRLHGMGESLHAKALQDTKKICRIYAPVGQHKDLLAYLVRRMLENGANSSFVNQLLDDSVAPEDLVRDPLNSLAGVADIANPQIALPPALFGSERVNSSGWDVNNALDAREFELTQPIWQHSRWLAGPIVRGHIGRGPEREVINPADPTDCLGSVIDATQSDAARAVDTAVQAQLAWQQTSPAHRAAILDRMAELVEANRDELMALMTREAGKTRVDGFAEIRETVDFCRYYAEQSRAHYANGERFQAQGVFVCISPWNFPLAIFTGQIVAALVMGNAVVAKPAEQTSLVAARMAEVMFAAGIAPGVLNLLPGDGAIVGAALCADINIDGICFTGSSATASSIDRALAVANPRAPLIAETGGLNTMIVDSTALIEAAVRDVVQSAFQSAGQRCSALRVLFIQHDIETEFLAMLEGACSALHIANPLDGSSDVGPVIDAGARQKIAQHCQTMTEQGRLLFAHPMADDLPDGHFVAPIAFRLDRLDQLDQEVFGPVLHVISYSADQLDQVIEQINDSGFGLTFGLHSRIDSRVASICDAVNVGNAYVNRNQIGAVVGVQPFGGEGLSGTGPKAGGPHYLHRFVKNGEPIDPPASRSWPDAVDRWDSVTDLSAALGRTRAAAREWARNTARLDLLRAAVNDVAAPLGDWGGKLLDRLPLAFSIPAALPGPTGETNALRLVGRGVALCLGGGTDHKANLFSQALMALAAGNAVILFGAQSCSAANYLFPALLKAGVPSGLLACIEPTNQNCASAEEMSLNFADPVWSASMIDLVLLDDSGAIWSTVRSQLALRDGARTPLVSSHDAYYRFGHERVISIDTTASGGNASLLMLEDG